MIILMSPLVFLLSWWFWLAGHISYLIMDCRDDEAWVHFWWPHYHGNMENSYELQEAVDGHGKLWPWGEPVVPEEQ